MEYGIYGMWNLHIFNKNLKHF